MPSKSAKPVPLDVPIIPNRQDIIS